RTFEPWLSVTLTASTQSRSSPAVSVIAPVPAPRGGLISAVTAKPPDVSRSLRPLMSPPGPARDSGQVPYRQYRRSRRGQVRRPPTTRRRGLASSSARNSPPSGGGRWGGAAGAG